LKVASNFLAKLIFRSMIKRHLVTSTFLSVLDLFF